MSRRVGVALVLLALACQARRPPEQAPPTPRAEAPRPAPAGQPPDAKWPAGAEVVRADCLACHTEDLLQQQRLTGRQWARSIDKMRGWGAPTMPGDLDALAEYLATTYAHDSGPFLPQTLTAEESAALFEPEPDGALAGGDRDRGLALYGDRCLPCHEADGRGGPQGIGLTGRRILDRAADFAETVRKGGGRMPGFPETTDAEAGDLLSYLRSLPAR